MRTIGLQALKALHLQRVCGALCAEGEGNCCVLRNCKVQCIWFAWFGAGRQVKSHATGVNA